MQTRLCRSSGYLASLTAVRLCLSVLCKQGCTDQVIPGQSDGRRDGLRHFRCSVADSSDARTTHQRDAVRLFAARGHHSPRTGLEKSACRERKCAVAIGTVPVTWAGHFQCKNINIFFTYNMRKEFYRKALGNCYGLKLPKC